MAAPVRVTVYDTQVDGLFRPGGQAWNWMGLVGSEHVNAAIAYAPKRTGHLSASHWPVPIMTPYGRGAGCRYTVRNDADYALYVHAGTSGPIYPWGDHLWVPMVRGMDDPRFLTKFVAGQEANPWIERAANLALAPFL